MAESTSQEAAGSAQPSENQPAPGSPPQNSVVNNPVVVAPDPNAAAPAGGSAASPSLSVKYLADKLEEAELLLGYAAEVGIEVDDQVRDNVLKARIASNCGSIPEATAAHLLTALTTLAVDVRPVTVESLRAWAHPEKSENKEIALLTPIAIFVVCVIVVFSLLTFVSKSISDKISTNIDAANGLAAKLRVELGPPPSLTDLSPAETTPSTNNPGILAQDQVWFGPAGIPAGLTDKDVITDLQKFAATMREIDGYARQLRHCLFSFGPFNYDKIGTNRMSLELTPGLNVRLSQELTEKVAEYEQVRSFGNQLVEKITVYYGAIAITILPVLYALLGAVAYLLRSIELQSKNRTWVARETPITRLLVACIGGLVVGQFNNVTQGINITPFAVAFLVGYAVDVFFTFLEGLLQMFVNKRGPGNT